MTVGVLAQPASTPSAPPLPKFHSPVEFFRQLLAATPSERDEMLSDHADEKRRVILTKIQEYTILPPPVREWRLKATELRYYLLPLMKRAPQSRGDLFEMVPEPDKDLVASRLRQWDALPAAEREAMLDSQIALRYLSRPGRIPPPPLPPSTGETFQKLEKTVDEWQSLPKAKQDTITDQFHSFFTLSTTEKQKTIAVFTGTEKEHLQKIVHSFEGLSDRDRRQCVVAVRKIASMSGSERAAFLRNVQRWKSLSETDRRQWRTLVAKVPPLPPGFSPLPER